MNRAEAKLEPQRLDSKGACFHRHWHQPPCCFLLTFLWRNNCLVPARFQLSGINSAFQRGHTEQVCCTTIVLVVSYSLSALNVTCRAQTICCPPVWNAHIVWQLSLTVCAIVCPILGMLPATILMPSINLVINVLIAFGHFRKGRGYFGWEFTSSVKNILPILFPFNG